MYDVKSLSIEELRNLASIINREIDIRRQNEINQAIDDFKHAFNRLLELRVDVQYSPDTWNDDTVYLRDGDGFNFC